MLWRTSKYGELIVLCSVLVMTGCLSRRADSQSPGPAGPQEAVGFRDGRERVDTLAARATDQRLHALAQLLECVASRTGQLPEDLQALAVDTPYCGRVRDEATRDYWGNAIEYIAKEGKYELRSRGLDKIAGTADDLVITGRKP
jgi:hypothetical protein